MTQTVLTVSLLTLILAALSFPFSRATAQKERRVEEPFVAGRVLVKFRSNIGLDHARQIIAALGARDADELPAISVFVLDLPTETDEAGFARAMSQRPEV